jgi:hypothetical protein
MTECTYTVSKRKPDEYLAIGDLVVMPDGSVDMIDDVMYVTGFDGDEELSYKIGCNLYPFFAVDKLDDEYEDND